MLVSLILFLLFLDRFLHRLRPVAVAAFVARAGRRAFEEGVAAAAARETPDVLPPGYEPAEEPARVVRSTGAGAIQALDGRGLVRYARQTGVGSCSATASATSCRRAPRSSRSTATTRARAPSGGCEG